MQAFTATQIAPIRNGSGATPSTLRTPTMAAVMAVVNKREVPQGPIFRPNQSLHNAGAAQQLGRFKA